jgi:outer membrane protein TolC
MAGWANSRNPGADETPFCAAREAASKSVRRAELVVAAGGSRRRGLYLTNPLKYSNLRFHMRNSFLLLVFGWFLALDLPAQPTNQTSRTMSLLECIQLAVEHNLDVQILRYAPEISRYNLAGAYGVYDPVFDFRGSQSFNSSPGGFNPAISLQAPPTETYQEAFSAGFTGRTPTGLTYDLGADLIRSSGTFGRLDTNNTFIIENRGFQYRTDAGINLRQSLLRDFWIDSARMTIAVNKKNLKISEATLLWQIMNTVVNVEQAYYDLIFTIENVRVQEKAKELADRLLAENKKRVEVGAMAPLDEKQAESQAAVSHADVLGARRSLDAQQNLLKSLITDDYLSWHNVYIEPSERLVPTPESFNLAESWQRGLAQRPDLLQLKLDLERRDIILKYSHNQLFPVLDLVGSYGRNGLGPTLEPSLDNIRRGDNPHWSYGAILNIPLSNRSARYQHRASKAEKQQALLRLKKLEQDVIIQIDDSIKLSVSDLERVDATRQARQYSEAALDAEQKRLESGKSTSFIVLQLQRDLTAARSAEIRALADYKKAISRVALSEGSTLERNRVDVDIR